MQHRHFHSGYLIAALSILVLAMTLPSTSSADLPGAERETIQWDDIQWEEKRDRDGIKVLTGDVPDSKLKAVMSVMRMQADLNELVGLVQDAAACPEWADLCKKAEQIEVFQF